MDELNFFARDKRLPRDMTIKLREFFTQTQDARRQTRYDVLLGQMSQSLKADAALCWAKETLLKVSYLGGGDIENEFLAACALSLHTKLFCRSESIPIFNMVVIERGMAAKNGRVMTKGGTLGIDMIINSEFMQGHRDLDPAIGLTFVVQAATLDKEALDRLLRDFPVASRTITKSAFFFTFRRAIMLVAAAVRRDNGVNTMADALVAVRHDGLSKLAAIAEKRNQRMLINNVAALAERMEVIGEEATATRDRNRADVDKQISELRTHVDGQVAELSYKLDAVLAALRTTRPLPSHSAATLPALPCDAASSSEKSIVALHRTRSNTRSGEISRPPGRRHRHNRSQTSTAMTAAATPPAVAQHTTGHVANGQLVDGVNRASGGTQGVAAQPAPLAGGPLLATKLLTPSGQALEA
uniref:Uncharacterized protein n=1 Tax=Haptolina brevifila TaxID=156173 RepID=A0A7S2JLG2_9EUKA